MAGHSKWANIKRTKGANDAKRGKIWTKISREITVSVKMGGKEISSNPRLRDAVALARTNNMPKDTINRAIAKGAGETDTDNYSEITYEGYGPGGAAVFVESMTDNKNRTVADLRTIFNKNGGNLGESGCVGWMFTKKGLIELEKNVSEELLFETAAELGAEDVTEGDESFEVRCELSDLASVREGLEKNTALKVKAFQIIAEPSNTIALEGENAEAMIKLLEALEDNDDVQRVHTNADFPEI